MYLGRSVCLRPFRNIWHTSVIAMVDGSGLMYVLYVRYKELTFSFSQQSARTYACAAGRGVDVERNDWRVASL